MLSAASNNNKDICENITKYKDIYFFAKKKPEEGQFQGRYSGSMMTLSFPLSIINGLAFVFRIIY